MYFILVFGVFTLGFIFERISALYLKMKTPAVDFRQQILSCIQRGDLKAADDYVRLKAAGTGLGAVVSTGVQLRTLAAGEEELQARMDERLTTEIAKIDRRTAFLAMFGNVATLLGLLGTISGMIQSFAAVANASPADRATLLSKGIAEAMNCTAFGLIVAIPALVAYAIFQNRTDRLVSALSEGTTQIYHDLLFLTEAGSFTQVTSAGVDSSGARASRPGLPQMSV